MAGSKSNYLEDEVLDHVLGGGDYTRPASVYVSLYSVAPTDAGGGTELTSGTAPGYARVTVTNNATNWPAASGGVKSNGTAIDFPANSNIVGGAAWPTVVAFGIHDASTAGNLLFWATLTTNRTIEGQEQASFPIGALVVTED